MQLFFCLYQIQEKNVITLCPHHNEIMIMLKGCEGGEREEMYRREKG